MRGCDARTRSMTLATTSPDSHDTPVQLQTQSGTRRLPCKCNALGDGLKKHEGQLDGARPYKVVVVDDSMTMQRWIGSVISKDPRLEIVGTAGTAEEARGVIKATNPDVLSLDIEMPGINGLEFLAHLMRLRPMPVVMLAGAMQGDSPDAKKALEIGAVACLAKPSFPTPASMRALCDHLVAAASGRPLPTPKEQTRRSQFQDKILLVGASTGGVAAIETFLAHLPLDTPPVVIAQHMPHNYLVSFVNRLDQLGAHRVGFAQDGARLEPGTVHLSPSQNRQTCVAWYGDAWHIQQVNKRYDHTFCPSVDVLFASGVPWARQVGAAILTGLGSDGAHGMLALRKNGAATIGQSKESCVVYGMPGAALALNATEEEAGIAEIAPKILARMRTTSKGLASL